MKDYLSPYYHREEKLEHDGKLILQFLFTTIRRQMQN